MQSERNFPQHVATAYFTNVWLICKFFKNVHNCRQCCYLISSSASRGSIRCSFASALPLNTQQSLKTVNGVNTLWPGAVMVRALNLSFWGRGFDSQLFHFQVTTLDKCHTYTHLSASVTKQYFTTITLVPSHKPRVDVLLVGKVTITGV